eukprot:TRINITY_DN12738_c0_g1_i1.p2 TRINITY_DN12738_c0_g1~~TRINITY_DN12738_c0_g1_i1.p2  ORF type:complete len:347 (+),score=57.02 TRINITY_DN12738_c0_g1_i1:189-1229(+)
MMQRCMDRCRSFQDELGENGRYKIVKQVGDGGFGVVMMAMDRQTKKDVAIKFMDRRHLFGNPRTIQDSVKRLQREICHHKLLSGHPNIIDFYEVFLTNHYLCIVMEYANGGDLFSVVEHCRENGVCLSEDESRYFFQQLIFAIDHCHKQNVVNQDIKLENALLQQQPDGSWIVKLCDFGYSKHLILNSRPRHCVGSLPYMCPEVLLADANPDQEYDAKKAEVWSCGVLLYSLLFGCYPFDPEQAYVEFFFLVKNMIYEFDDNIPVSDEAKDLISFMLLEEDMRYSIEDVLKHKWFKVNEPEMPEFVPAKIAQNDFEIQKIVQQARTIPRVEATENQIINQEIRKEE